ncbi:hypothetical protein VMCG_01997 [Cytospora schulzeri]|uniref:Fasciclin domain family protein n=1 Tax=Cytospora schulzeri TaxID=448051 RepID=A0A423X4Q1_9PEZI|nr:hypothetical protein VMCG_01997 [Valsa malicola]
MEEGAAAAPPLLLLSQASSHSPLDPVSGATLFEQEKKRRDGLRRRGNCLTGCRELDHEVLLGGFERGCVVGLSTEEEEVGLLIGLQAIANLFVTSLRSGDGPRPRAMVITTLSMGALLPVMRDVFRAQLAVHGRLDAGFSGLLKQFLGRISISRVFDVAGLWEALGELDSMAGHDEDGGASQDSPGGQHEGDAGDDEGETGEGLHASAADDEQHGEETAAPEVVAEPASSPLSDPPSSLPDEFDYEAALPEKTPPPGQRAEIADSEDEEGFSSPMGPPGVSPSPKLPVEGAKDMAKEEEPAIARESCSGQEPNKEGPSKQENSVHPDVILITHISTLLSALFRQREKDTAHQMLQLLSSHLRYLTRSPEHGGPLVMILNSTTSPTDAPTSNNNDTTTTINDRPQDPDRPPRPIEPGGSSTTTTSKSSNKPLDPTLRSIFNPPPLPVSGLNYTYDTPLSRRNKPSFGLVFTQLLDMHLLCTSVPKTRADAEAVYAPSRDVTVVSRGGSGGNKRSCSTRKDAIEYGWVVEVLLDEVGVWAGDGDEGRPRRFREQRWGAVDVWREDGGRSGGGGGGVRVVDAFEWREKVVPEIRLAGGFGGLRV